MTALSLPQALQRLADFRATDRRASQETFDHGVLTLKNSANRKMGDESGPGSTNFNQRALICTGVHIGMHLHTLACISVQ
jgi:hypothetical protein